MRQRRLPDSAITNVGQRWLIKNLLDGEWVPSKANLGDIMMTRPERYHELLEGLRKYQWYREANPEGPEEYELKLPPLGDSWPLL